MGRRKAGEMIERAAAVFDLPGEAAAGSVRVTVTGTSKVHIENHRGLLNYSENEITANGGRVIVRIRGEKLELAAMSDLELVIAGKVSSVEYVS